MLILLACLLQDKVAEETHERFGKQCAEAKSISLKFKVEVEGKETKLSIKGRLRFKGGDRYWVEMEMNQDGKKNRIEAKSDGKKTITLDDGERSEEDTEKDMSKLLTDAVAKCGIGILIVESAGKPGTAIQLSGFKSGVRGKDLQELEYDCAIGEALKCKVILTLNDGAPLKPRKRVVKLDEATITETYEEVSYDEIQDSEFEHKK